MNYGLQEYTNDVVYAIQAVCNAESVPHPDIVTEGMVFIGKRVELFARTGYARLVLGRALTMACVGVTIGVAGVLLQGRDDVRDLPLADRAAELERQVDDVGLVLGGVADAGTIGTTLIFVRQNPFQKNFAK